MPAIGKLLQPNVLARLVSQQMAAEQWILGFFGFEVGGRNEVNLGHGRRGNFDVFDNTRLAMEGRAPATAAGRIRRQLVKNIPFNYPRAHEQLGLNAEELHNLRQIGEDGARDVAGTRYIQKQTDYIAQRAANWRAALTVGMLRDSLFMIPSGDSLYPSFATGTNAIQINFQQPSNNQDQLDMGTGANIIDVSWDNPSADIPDHLGKIDAAFQSLYGGRLENIFCQSDIWQNVLKNDAVASQAGIANTPFTQFQRVVGTRADGSPINVTAATLSCRPFVNWYVTDEGLSLGAPGSESFTKYVGDNQALFLPNPNLGNFFMQIGSEPIAEFDGGPETVRFGQYMWSNKTYNPTTTNIYSLDNALAINDIPNSVARGTVVF